MQRCTWYLHSIKWSVAYPVLKLVLIGLLTVSQRSEAGSSSNLQPFPGFQLAVGFLSGREWLITPRSEIANISLLKLGHSSVQPTKLGCFENIVMSLVIIAQLLHRSICAICVAIDRGFYDTNPRQGTTKNPSKFCHRFAACLISHQKWEIFMTPCHGYLYNTRSGWSGWSACFLAKFLFVSPPASNFLFLTSLAIRAQSLHSQLPWFPGARSWESKLLFFCRVKNWRGGFLGLDDSWNVNVSGV